MIQHVLMNVWRKLTATAFPFKKVVNNLIMHTVLLVGYNDRNRRLLTRTYTSTCWSLFRFRQMTFAVRIRKSLFMMSYLSYGHPSWQINIPIEKCAQLMSPLRSIPLPSSLFRLFVFTIAQN